MDFSSAIDDALQVKDEMAKTLATQIDDRDKKAQAASLVTSVKSAMQSTPFWDDVKDEDGILSYDPAPQKKSALYDLLAHADNPYIAAVIPTISQQIMDESRSKLELANKMSLLRRDERTAMRANAKAESKAKDDYYKAAIEKTRLDKTLRPEYRDRIVADLERQHALGKEVSYGEAANRAGTKSVFVPDTEAHTPEEVESMVSSGSALRDAMGNLQVKTSVPYSDEDLYRPNRKVIGAKEYDKGIDTIFQDQDTGAIVHDFKSFEEMGFPNMRKMTNYSESNRKGGTKSSGKPRNAQSAADAVSGIGAGK